MDPFNLPAPLGLQILKQLPGFITLQLLLRASPAADTVFRAHALEIIHFIADLYLPLDSQRHLHAVLQIRSDRDSIPDLRTLSHFIHGYVYAGDTFLPRPCVLPPCPPALLPCLRGVVADAANIERLAAAVLDELVSRLDGLRPLRLDRSNYSWGQDPDIQNSFSRGTYWPFAGSEPPPTKAIPVDPRPRDARLRSKLTE